MADSFGMDLGAVVAKVDQLGGIATRRQLVAAGATGFGLTALVRSGRLRRIRNGWYASATATPAQRVAVRIGGCLVGLSAAASFGLWAGFDRAVHVGVPANASRLRTARSLGDGHRLLRADRGSGAAVLHWTEDPVQHRDAELWRVRLEVALCQVLEWADTETAIACLDSALGAKLTTKARVARELLLRRTRGRAWARLAASRPGSDSGLESVVRQRLEAVGLMPRQQVVIAGVGRVDMVLGQWLVVELDSREHHSSWEDVQRDQRRDATLVSLGYRVLRFSYHRVFAEWAAVLATIRAVLALL